MTLQIRVGTARDVERIRTLLTMDGLPTDDIEAAEPYFVVASAAGGRAIGAGALQWFGDAALLRSVTVAAEFRKAGLGRQIVAELERVARSARVSQVILLTTTARTFFERLGYQVKERQTVPESVRASAEFRSLCPASAVCMAKTLF